MMPPDYYAREARSLEPTDNTSSCIDEIKACTLLCIYDMAISNHWTAATNIAKVAKLAELYHVSRLEIPLAERNKICGGEEWKSIWWTIYTLDTICSAIS